MPQFQERQNTRFYLKEAKKLSRRSRL